MEKTEFFKPKSVSELREQFGLASLLSDHPEEQLSLGSAHPENLEYVPSSQDGKGPSRSLIYRKVLKALKNQQELSPQKAQEYKNYLRVVNNLRVYLDNLHLDEHLDLKDIQVDIIEDILKNFEGGNTKGYVKAPTGLGKTVIFLTIAKAVNVKTLIVVPKQALVDQTHDRASQFAPDLGIGKVYQHAKEYDEQATIITYQSLVAKIQNGEVNPQEYGLVILDEAHETLGGQTSAAIDQFTSPVIGFTATPQFDVNATRHVRNILGTEFHSVGVQEAVEEGYLAGFHNIVVKTKTSLKNVTINGSGEYNQAQLEKAVNNAGRNKAAVDLYFNENFYGQKAIFYCSGVDHAEEMAKILNEREPGIAMAISSRLKTKERQEILEKHASGQIKIVTNSDMLIEGHDDPEVNLCFNLRPSKSLIVVEQRGGRALRINKSEPEKLAYIVDFLDEYNGSSSPILYASAVNGSYFVPKKKQKKTKPDDNDGTGPDVFGPEGGDDEDDEIPELILLIDDVEIVTDVDEVMRLGEKDFTQKESKEFYTFEEAKQAVQKLRISSLRDYRAKYKIDSRLPSLPEIKYKQDWKGLSDFLRNEPKEFYKTYQEAKEAVQKLGINTGLEYSVRYKEDPRLISRPHIFYRDNWQSWGVFLNKGEKIEFYTYEEAQKKVKELRIRTRTQYNKARESDFRLPANPYLVYKDDWISETYFYTGVDRIQHYTYEEAQKKVKELGISSHSDYQSKRKIEPRLPSNPNLIYKQAWKNWAYFLTGEGKITFYSFAEAQVVLQKNGIDSQRIYKQYYKADKRLPSNPNITYGSDWKGWAEFLRTKKSS